MANAATDPDIVLALYPDSGFPFLPSKFQLLWESPERKSAREDRDKERAQSGPLLDDLIEVILFVDAYNFKDADAYCGNSICFRLSPTRADLERFYEELRDEYMCLRARCEPERRALTDDEPVGAKH